MTLRYSSAHGDGVEGVGPGGGGGDFKRTRKSLERDDPRRQKGAGPVEHDRRAASQSGGV